MREIKTRNPWTELDVFDSELLLVGQMAADNMKNPDTFYNRQLYLTKEQAALLAAKLLHFAGTPKP